MPAAKSGVSRSVKVSIVGSSDSRSSSSRTASHQTRVLNKNKIICAREEGQKKAAANVLGLGADTRRLLSELRGESVMPPNDGLLETAAEMANTGDVDMEWETLPDDLRQDEAFIAAARDIYSSRWKRHWYRDMHRWHQRRECVHASWTHLMPALVDAYIGWKYPPPHESPPPPGSPPPLGSPPLPGSPPPPRSSYDFSIPVLDVYTLATEANISRGADSNSVAEALVCNGFLGATLESPTLAVGLKTLELYRCIRLCRPSFSVEAFAKVICDLYGVPYKQRFRLALENAFDVYLAILRDVDRQVLRELGREDDTWQIINGCPPCGYELEGEALLKWRHMMGFDGNNSLKRMADAQGCLVGDTRTFKESIYYLGREFVDELAGEVGSTTQRSNEDNDLSNERDAEPHNSEGIPDCHKNWKAAAEDEKKCMWGIFEETGIFASACRHGLMLWIADMVRSSEQFKYPLATIKKAMGVLGEWVLVGSDVGCKLAVTIANSSLGEEFKKLRWCMCTNAFHGYAHNYHCQLENHPNHIDGAGLEDLEMLKRVFSSSDHVAPLTRYASRFRRHVFIELFFRQWDEEKYLNLANMLLNNYKQALDIIKNEGTALAEAKCSLSIEEGDIERWLEEESQYFKTLGEEPEWDVFATEYVERLQKLRELDSQYGNALVRFLNSTPTDYHFVPPSSQPFSSSQSYETELSQTRRAETAQKHLSERRDAALHEVIEMEVKMGIATRWEPTMPEYMETLRYITKRKYFHALDNLQRLVVLHLFELHKLNLSHTAYAVRTHLAKSIQTRCKAVRNAVEAYNDTAAALIPPRPQLDWTAVSHYMFLEEFNLLRDTRQDVRTRCWADAAVCATMKQHLRVQRAHEEINRCNIEVRRLHTAIRDEHRVFAETLSHLWNEGSRLLGPVQDFIARRRKVNEHLQAKISQIHSLAGFTGNMSYGTRKGTSCPVPDSMETSDETAHNSDAEDGEENEELDDEGRGDMGSLVDFVSELPYRT